MFMPTVTAERRLTTDCDAFNDDFRVAWLDQLGITFQQGNLLTYILLMLINNLLIFIAQL